MLPKHCWLDFVFKKAIISTGHLTASITVSSVSTEPVLERKEASYEEILVVCPAFVG